MGVSKMGLAMAVLLMIAMINHPAMVEGITCGQVTSSLGQCLSYLKAGGAKPPPLCCKGVTSLNSMAKTTADRRQACTCLKQIANSVKGINYSVAAGLPGKCGVKIPYAISPSTDCSTVT